MFAPALLLSLFGWLLPGTAPSPADSTVRVGAIHIVGNTRTRQSIVQRELSVRENSLYSTQKIDSLIEADRRKVVNTNLFITVEIKKEAVSDSVIDLRVLLKERWYFIVTPVFQLADRNFNEWWYERGRDIRRTTYGIYAAHQNLTGRNDRLRMLAEFGFLPKFDLFYTTPYIDRAQKTGMTIGLSYAPNKTVAYRTKADKLVYLESERLNRTALAAFVAFTYRPQFYGLHNAELRYVSAAVSDTLAGLNPNFFLDGRTKQRFFQLSYGYTYDRRDNVQFPLRGWSYSFLARKYGILPTDDVNQLDLTFSYARFHPLGGRWFSDFSSEIKTSFPRRQPYAQTRGLGFGGDLVRGYELYAIDGQAYWYARTNLNYKLWERLIALKFVPLRQFNVLPLAIYPSVYVDFGYAKNNFKNLNNSNLANSFLMGGGVGMNFVTWYNIVARVNYSINLLGEKRFYFTVAREY